MGSTGHEGSRTLAYWATIEHHRMWLTTDGAHFGETRARQSLELDTAKRIVREYGVARNIGRVSRDDDMEGGGLEPLVEAINNSEWPDSLQARAAVCIDLASGHYDRGKRLGKAMRVHRPISAVTKLMWFLRPKGWTMFDSFARIGLIGGKNDPKRFYAVLEEYGFQERAAHISETCKAFDLPLHGERIIDKFLLLRGSKAGVEGTQERTSYFDASRSMNRWHLELLPKERRNALKGLAVEVASLLPDHDFPQQLSSRRKRLN